MRFVLVLTLVCLGAMQANATPWDRFHGPNGSGTAAEANIPVQLDLKQNLLWKVAVPGNGNASPVVWDKRIFIHSASDDGRERLLLCLDTATGKTLWTRKIDGTRAKIRPDSSLASSTPAIDGTAVFVVYWDGKDQIAAAYDFQGEPLWQRNLGPFISQHGPGASPILYEDKLILANDMDKEDPATKQPVARPSLLIALDKKTGAVAWEVLRVAHRACYGAPFIRAGKTPELIVVSTTAVTSYEPKTGTQNWDYPDWQAGGVKSPLRTISAPILVGSTLVASGGDGPGERFAAGMLLPEQGAPTKRVWENKKDFPYVPCPLQRDGKVYFVNDAGMAGCYDAATGQRVWQERLPDAKFYASPVLIDGKIYAPSEQGDLFVLAAEPSFRLLARNTIGERLRATPAVADGRLYVRGQHHLFCLGKGEAK